ncbi:Galactose oxidase/kelch repeat superfamily protein [Prunus dulcis]|uniref:Galactose oxidase/kelch repeat superfamily protein n=1 Tax=Prunus dulcis TaxID=3755 RepID=A0A4Y1R7V2_PRUDU|nr:Galactose oxidase/kelch repeat superfamily protein [Prunus dulcis]
MILDLDMDQRLKELEIQVRSLVSGQQQILDKFSELSYTRNSKTIRDHEDDANGGRHCSTNKNTKGTNSSGLQPSYYPSLHMEGECEKAYKSVFIVAQHFGRLYEGVLYEVKIEQGSGAIIRGRPGRALVGEEDRPPLLNPVNKIFGESDMVKPYSCRLVALRFKGLSKLYMLLTARDVLRHSLRSTTTAPTKPDLKGRIFDTETKSFYTFTHPKSFNRRFLVKLIHGPLEKEIQTERTLQARDQAQDQAHV